MSTTGSSPDTPSFESRPTLQYAATVGMQSALVGAFVSSVQNALGTHSRGASGFLSRTGGTIGFFAAMGATFAATESIVANQRETQDALNGVAGGCAAGFLAGIRARSLPIAVASCAVIGAAVGTFDTAGQSLRGDQEALSYEEKRKRFFKQTSSSPPLSSLQ
ncbi:hypothetical protein BGY98DRAFT_1094746 [Russula aff. rugulosa BPL654]|nr:hypothetical protein BGY98DRAFT_1094746 [Russula aff. rugulosa BPL654]